VDVAGLYQPAGESVYANVNRPGLISLAAGIVAGWSWQYGLVPAMQGPVATALGNSDFSWLAGSLVAGALYWTLAKRAAVGRVCVRARSNF
jgi:cytosine/uracil/thiamine/allantoin permease